MENTEQELREALAQARADAQSWMATALSVRQTALESFDRIETKLTVLDAEVLRLVAERDRLKAALADAEAERIALADELRHWVWTHDDKAGHIEAALYVQNIIDMAGSGQRTRG
jgi:chromosome segregation ATPase